MLRALVPAIRGGALAGAQILVRLHPRDEMDAYREFEGVPDVIIEKPFRDTVKVADGLAIDVMPEHQRHLGDTLRLRRRRRQRRVDDQRSRPASSTRRS